MSSLSSPTCQRRALVLIVAMALSPLAAAAEADPDFDAKVAPILVDRCLKCHSGPDSKGGLNLSVADAARKGGESGVAWVAGNAAESLLWQRIDSDEMPPKHPLDAKERQTIRQWISAGAVWGSSPLDYQKLSTADRAGRDWWSLQPLDSSLNKPASEWGTNPIDAFVAQRLEAAGLSPSPRATERELIRRACFDLLGFPPTPQQLSKYEQRLKEDAKTGWSDLVKELLASRHYGERWGRHWLDVVRFGESQGFERDKLRPDSWHYRDWVIEALNTDMPYDKFVRLQLAGDILAPEDPAAVTATGFLVAGPWDEVGQSMQSVAMKKVVRQDEIEDYVGTIGQTFLGLTINCARCHDHKFDPITQKEYYQLAAAVDGVRHGTRTVISAKDRDRAAELGQNILAVRGKLSKLYGRVRNRLRQKQGEAELPNRVTPIARWDFENDTNDSIGASHANQHPKAVVAEGRLVLDRKTGYAATHDQEFDLYEKTLEAWVRLDNLAQRNGAAISIHTKDSKFDAIVFAERQPGKWMAGSDFFRRTQNLDAPREEEADREFVHLAITYARDGMIACYRNGQPYGSPYQTKGLQPFLAGQWYVLFGLRTGGPNPNRQLEGRLEAAQLYDRALTADEVKASFECEAARITPDQILAALSPEEMKQETAWKTEIANLQQARTKFAPYPVYAVRPGKTKPAHVLLRGNPANPDEPVTPGGVAAIGGLSSDFELSGDATDDERRKKLAEWITSRNNPLFSRVIVNRLWHYHFGAGIVTTPNDFGFNGGRPSHPKLLDWLSGELIKSNWSLKYIHRLILESATYQQSSRSRADCVKVDADNRLLWRKSPLRLEAEALRDTILSVAGELNPRYGGQPYRDFTTFVNNTQFYTMTDPDDPDVYRRTVYRTWIRSGRNHFLDAFDCPDPSTTAPQRAVTTTPIQSLSLMNDSFVLRMSDRFAARVIREAGSEIPAQIDRVFQLGYGRPAGDEEIATLSEFVAEHKLPALCRIVFNSNEFIMVD